MSPLIALAIEVLLKYGPAAYAEIVDLIHNPAPTKEDFKKVLQFATQKSYDDYVHPGTQPPVLGVG